MSSKLTIKGPEGPKGRRGRAFQHPFEQPFSGETAKHRADRLKRNEHTLFSNTEALKKGLTLELGDLAEEHARIRGLFLAEGQGPPGPPGDDGPTGEREG